MEEEGGGSGKGEGRGRINLRCQQRVEKSVRRGLTFEAEA